MIFSRSTESTWSGRRVLSRVAHLLGPGIDLGQVHLPAASSSPEFADLGLGGAKGDWQERLKLPLLLSDVHFLMHLNVKCISTFITRAI